MQMQYIYNSVYNFFRLFNSPAAPPINYYLLYEDFVVLEWNLSASERNVQTAMTGMDFAGGQTTLVECPANVQRLSSIRVSSNDSAWWNGTMSTGHPSSIRYAKHLELVLQNLLSTPCDVHGVLSRHELSRNLFSLVEGAGYVDLGAIRVVASNDSLWRYSLTRRPTHPTDRGHRRDQHFVLQGTVLCSSVGKVKTSVGGVDFTRRQATLMLRATDKQGLATDCRARLDRVGGHMSISTGDPRKSCASQNLEREI